MKFCWSFVMAIVLPAVSYCQSQADSIRLAILLPELANIHATAFSYSDQIVKDIFVDGDLAAIEDLTQILDLLERQSKLRMELLDDGFVLVRPFQPDDIVSICGNIHANSGEGLIGVSIAADSINHTGTVTDVSGNFEFQSIAYGSMLTLSYVGHETIRIPVSEMFGMECPSISLAEEVSFLKELIVYDYLTKGITKRQNKINISVPEFGILPGLIEPDLLQSIQQTPGVSSPFETASGIHVRGGAPDQNLVLWNGIKTYNQGHFFGMISAFNPYLSEKVEFIKNGTPSRFGDRVSSVIDISSNQDVIPKFSGGAGFNMIYGDAFINTPVIKDKLSVQLSARRSHTDLVNTFTYKQMADRVFQNTKITDDITAQEKAENKFFFNDFTSNIVYQISNSSKLIGNMLYNYNDLHFTSTNEASAVSFSDELFNANEGYSLQYQFQNKKNEFSVSSNFSKYLLQYDFSTTQADTLEVSSKKNAIQDIGFQIENSHKLSSYSTLTTGFQYSNAAIRHAFETFTDSYSLILASGDEKMNVFAPYLEWRRITEKLYLTSGLRINRYEEINETTIEPRVLVEVPINEKIGITTSGEFKSQAASQIKESIVSDLSLENQIWTLSSQQGFPLIKSKQITLGGNYNYHKTLVDIEGYLKEIEGVTTLTFGFLNPIDNVFRIGNSSIRGFDALVEKEIESFNLWASYSYIFSENEFTGLNNGEAFPGNWNIEHTIKTSVSYRKADYYLSGGWIWHTGKSFTRVEEIIQSQGPVEVVFGSLNGENLPIYHRLDLSFLKEWRKETSTVRYRAGISVLNVYNRQNILNREYRRTPALNSELIDTKIYSIGITPNLVFRVFW